MDSSKSIIIFLALFIPYSDPIQATLLQEEEEARSLTASEDILQFLTQMDKFSKEYGEKWIVMPDGNGHPVYGTLEYKILENDKSRTELTFDKLVENVNLFLHTPEQQDGIKLNLENLSTTELNPSNPIRIICHGWMASVDSSVVRNITKAYLAQENNNVIGVDWSSFSGDFFYPAAAISTHAVGKYLGLLIDNLVETHKVRYSDIHIIGHSLGAHVAGFAGSSTKEKVGRITGLDPALPGFQYVQGREGRLDESDAEFVDVIHTCSGILGMSVPAGHVDFYPNGGSPFQPGCTNNLLLTGKQACSHSRSHEFFAESISKKTEFSAVKCQDWEHFKKHECENVFALMGEYVSKNISGIFYLKTNEVSPFAKGLAGTVF